MPEWPGYTPPSSGSSQNAGTPVLSSYTNREAAIAAAYAADGADTTQQPPQYYGAWSAQKRADVEGHGTPSTPGKPTVAASGTSGTATVTWTGGPNLPALGFLVTASTGQTKTVAGNVFTANVSGLTVAGSVTFTVTALGYLNSSPASAASNSYTVV